MPVTTPASDQRALRDALSAMRIDMPGGGPGFEQILAATNGWTLGFAERVSDEYCGFLYLAATGDEEATPSRAVDQAWHLHLKLPHYREILCGQILGRPLDHRPATGAPAEEERCRRQYERTLERYEQVFGKPPPADIWPRPVRSGAPGERRRHAGGGSFSLGLSAASGAAGLAAFALGVPVLGLILLGLSLIFFLFTLPFFRARGDGRDTGSCGGGCSFGGDGDGGGSSCGGGCGGD